MHILLILMNRTNNDQVLCFWHGWFANNMCRWFWGDASTAVAKGKHPTDCASGYIFIICWNAEALKPCVLTLRSDCHSSCALQPWGCGGISYPLSQMNTEVYHFPSSGSGRTCKVWAPTIFYWKGTHSYSSFLLAKQFLSLKSKASLMIATQAWNRW